MEKPAPHQPVPKYVKEASFGGSGTDPAMDALSPEERAALVARVKNIPSMKKTGGWRGWRLGDETNPRSKYFRVSAKEHEVEWAAEALFQQEKCLMSLSIPETAADAGLFLDSIKSIQVVHVLDKRPDHVRATVIRGEQHPFEDDYWRVDLAFENLRPEALGVLNQIPEAIARVMIGEPLEALFRGTVEEHSANIRQVARRCAMFPRICLSYNSRGWAPPYKNYVTVPLGGPSDYLHTTGLFVAFAVWQSLARDGGHQLRYGPKKDDVFPCIPARLYHLPERDEYHSEMCDTVLEVCNLHVSIMGCSIEIHTADGEILLHVHDTDLLTRVRTARVVAFKTGLPLKHCLQLVTV